METEPGPETDLATLATELETENITFVDDLNDEIADLVETSDHLDYDYICGDVSDYGVSANGHGHFDLVHDEATIHCVVFASRLDRVGADIEDGTQAAVKGDISYYESEGQVSLFVRQVVPVGDGIYQQVYEQNKRALEQDGLLDDATKQSLPEFPTRIGIATSADSDAREDAVTSIHDRHPDVDVVVHDTTVQGDDALMSLMNAVSALDDDPQVDVIVVTRGGGADKHLRVFNETPLCRVVHRTTTPTVSAIGHEKDRTLVDEVADQHVMTPTEVGQIAPRKDNLQSDLEELSAELDQAYARAVQDRLDDLRTQLDSAYDRHVTDELADLSSRLDHAYETLEQQKEHEQEKAAAVESYQHTTTRQRALIAILLALFLLTLALLLLNL
ncbi:exodeoxyribonuclease VII large subunit [Halosimplex aquaticum]|uniref:Exodeoxyribonuclease VII large subunit n=1 Tax=Halosimplex aquaticum TaxID=3026162 RepID=A0ABD5XTS2_9EURY|nr:exodeoxyribonuclease VII large subunit [Halosimplex aquaticum]